MKNAKLQSVVNLYGIILLLIVISLPFSAQISQKKSSDKQNVIKLKSKEEGVKMKSPKQMSYAKIDHAPAPVIVVPATNAWQNNAVSTIIPKQDRAVDAAGEAPILRSPAGISPPSMSDSDKDKETIIEVEQIEYKGFQRVNIPSKSIKAKDFDKKEVPNPKAPNPRKEK